MVNSKPTALLAAASFLTAFAMAGLSGPWTVTATAAPAAEESGERTVEDGGTGPYKAIVVGDSSLPTHTIYRPKDLSAFSGRTKLPILAWGNGGCANSSRSHQNYLSEIASHGFLIVAIGPLPAPGDGRGGGAPAGGPSGGTLLQAINWAIAQNSDNASPYKGKLDVSKVAVFGHSCGGLQALEVSGDPRVSTTLVVDSGILINGQVPGRGNAGGAPGGAPAAAPGAGAPGGAPGAAPGAPGGGAPGGARAGGGARGGGGLTGMPPLTKEHLAKLHAPVFYLLGGKTDIAYENGMDDFMRIDKVPVFVANKDVGHGGTFGQPHGSDWAMASVAWLKWQLKGDAEAGKLFTGNPPGLSKIEGWTVDKKNIR
jgi:hypothetical protein